MNSTRELSSWHVPLPSGLISTIAVILIDLIVIWVLFHCLRQIGACLTARIVYEKHAAVRLSELWFDGIVGGTQGPIWFRVLHALLILAVMAASIVMGLSIDGVSGDVELAVPLQTTLMLKPRTLASHGLGAGFNNYSEELLFTLKMSECQMLEFNKQDFFNYRSLIPLQRRYMEPTSTALNLECLHELNGFKKEPLYSVDLSGGRTRCKLTPPTRSEIANGTAKMGIRNCNATSVEFKCTNEVAGACAGFFTDEIRERIIVVYYYGEMEPQTLWFSSALSLPRNNETLSVIAHFASHISMNSLSRLQLMAAFQPTPNRTVFKLLSGKSLSKIDKSTFLSSAAVILCIFTASIAFACAASFEMWRKGRTSYNLAFCTTGVARLASFEHALIGRGTELFFKLHPQKQLAIISAQESPSGAWREEDVQNKYS